MNSTKDLTPPAALVPVNELLLARARWRSRIAAWFVTVDEPLLQRARRSRRVGAAFTWSRVPVRYPGDQPTPEIALDLVVEEPRHQLGGGPEMVDIRTLVPVRDDVTSTGRHAALDEAVLAALCGAGAR